MLRGGRDRSGCVWEWWVHVHEEAGEGWPIDAGRMGMPPMKPGGGPPAVPNARSGPSGRASGSASVIGTDLTITGNLESKGEVQIEGEVQGDIHAQRIVIGERARITGALIAEEMVVRGNGAGVDPRQQRDVPVRRAASKATFSTSLWRSSRVPSSKASRAARRTRCRCSAPPTACPRRPPDPACHPGRRAAAIRDPCVVRSSAFPCGSRRAPARLPRPG